jgi:glycosyltransferase involved in cell wall biosynthesis
MAALRILHLTDRLSDRGGAHWHLLGVLAALRERGHDVHLAAGAHDGHTAAPCAWTLVKGLESRTRTPVDIDPLLDAVRPDLIHVHTVVNPAVLDWAASQRSLITVQDHRYFCPTRGKWTAAGRPCVEVMDEQLCGDCFDDRAYFQQIYALTAERLAALRRLPAVLVLSQYMRRELLAVGLGPDQVQVIPPFVHGLDVETEAEGPPCLLFVGRLAESKGVAEALACWKRSDLGLPLVVAGTGPLRHEMESGGATVLGWIDHHRLAPLYRRARVMLMPSRWQEPFGIAGLEAVTLGTPVAAWASGGIPEWHPGGPGLVPWGDTAGLAEAVRAVAGRKVLPPAGFERDPLMDRLLAVYAHMACPASTAPRFG